VTRAEINAAAGRCQVEIERLTAIPIEGETFAKIHIRNRHIAEQFDELARLARLIPSDIPIPPTLPYEPPAKQCPVFWSEDIAEVCQKPESERA
jgi:hypothetical protein